MLEESSVCGKGDQVDEKLNKGIRFVYHYFDGGVGDDRLSVFTARSAMLTIMVISAQSFPPKKAEYYQIATTRSGPNLGRNT
jgi:hypothetical protein